MMQGVERAVQLQEVQTIITTLWETPSPLDYTTTYQDFCCQEAFPKIEELIRLRASQEFGADPATRQQFDVSFINEGNVKGLLLFEFSPDSSQSGLADAWISHSTLTISWLSEGKLWLMVARLAQYPGFCGLEELQIRSDGQIKNPLAIANRRELEGRDQRARYLAY